MTSPDHADRAPQEQPDSPGPDTPGTGARQADGPSDPAETASVVVGWDDGSDWTGEPSAWTLADEYPELRYLAWMAVDDARLEPFRRHRAGGDLIPGWLRANGCYLISDVLDLTEDSILEWHAIGAGKLRMICDFLAVVAGNALPLLAEQVQAGSPPPAAGGANPTEPLATWAQLYADARTWGDLFNALRERSLPADVAAAWSTWKEEPLPTAADLAPAGTVVNEWLDGLTPRDAAIVRGRILKYPGQTLDEIGQQFGVTRERVRQRETALKAELDRLQYDEQGRTVSWQTTAIREHLGACAPVGDLSQLQLSNDDMAAKLLLNLAGYRLHADQLHRDDFKPPTSRGLPLVDADLPVVDEETLRLALIEQGVRPDLTDWLVDSIDGVNRIDGHLVLWPRNIVDKCVAVLAVTGTPMTPEDLATAAGEEPNLRSLRQRLYEDPRVRRTTRATVGLEVWGGEEYTTLVDLMATRLENDGELPLQDLIDDLVTRFEATPGSVAAYSAAPVFVVHNGMIRLRGPDELFEVAFTPGRVSGLFQADPERLVWTIPADSEVMRGSGRTLPTEIAAFLSLGPGQRIVLHNDLRPLPISWPVTNHVGPSLGSIKLHAEALGTQTGDHLHLWFDRANRRFSVQLAADRPQEPTIAGQVAWLTGLPADRCQDRRRLAQAVHTNPAHLVEHLATRGDRLLSELAAQLP